MLTSLRGAKSLHPAFVDSIFAVHRSLGLLKGSTLVDGEFDDFDPLEYPLSLSFYFYFLSFINIFIFYYLFTID